MTQNNKRFYDFEGRKALLRHVRDGVELPEIIRDDHYDFNFQVSFTGELKWNETTKKVKAGWSVAIRHSSLPMKFKLVPTSKIVLYFFINSVLSFTF